jgi:cytochrome c-type biogenesis protein CcmH/NrfF
MTLSACPSSDARSLRVEIESRFEKGYTEDAVINELKMRFGEKILPAPQDALLNNLAFLAPWCFIAIALLLVARYVRNLGIRAAERKIKS